MECLWRHDEGDQSQIEEETQIRNKIRRYIRPNRGASSMRCMLKTATEGIGHST